MPLPLPHCCDVRPRMRPGTTLPRPSLLKRASPDLLWPHKTSKTNTLSNMSYDDERTIVALWGSLDKSRALDNPTGRGRQSRLFLPYRQSPPWHWLLRPLSFRCSMFTSLGLLQRIRRPRLSISRNHLCFCLGPSQAYAPKTVHHRAFSCVREALFSRNTMPPSQH